MIFNFIISHVSPEKFIKTPQILDDDDDDNNDDDDDDDDDDDELFFLVWLTGERRLALFPAFHTRCV